MPSQNGSKLTELWSSAYGIKDRAINECQFRISVSRDKDKKKGYLVCSVFCITTLRLSYSSLEMLLRLTRPWYVLLSLSQSLLNVPDFRCLLGANLGSRLQPQDFEEA